MQLELGKRYVTRDGQISGQVEANPGSDQFPFKARIGGTIYAFLPDGYFQSYRVGPHDLVAEYVEPESEIRLEVGKRYFTRDGRVSGPVEANYGDNNELYPFKATIGQAVLTFQSNGRFRSGKKTDLDLVAEYVEPVESEKPSKFVASPNGGLRDDSEKPIAHEVLGAFARALLEVSHVGTFGARKYAVDNWLGLEPHRVWNSLLRHYLAHCRGEIIDPESGLAHLAHMAWNALAILELTLREAEK